MLSFCKEVKTYIQKSMSYFLPGNFAKTDPPLHPHSKIGGGGGNPTQNSKTEHLSVNVATLTSLPAGNKWLQSLPYFWHASSERMDSSEVVESNFCLYEVNVAQITFSVLQRGVVWVCVSD